MQGLQARLAACLAIFGQVVDINGLSWIDSQRFDGDAIDLAIRLHRSDFVRINSALKPGKNLVVRLEERDVDSVGIGEKKKWNAISIELFDPIDHRLIQFENILKRFAKKIPVALVSDSLRSVVKEFSGSQFAAFQGRRQRLDLLKNFFRRKGAQRFDLSRCFSKVEKQDHITNVKKSGRGHFFQYAD